MGDGRTDPAQRSGRRYAVRRGLRGAAPAGQLARDRARGPHRFALGLAPDAAAAGEVPDGYRDYIAEAGQFADAPPPAYWAIRPADPGSPDGTSHQQWADVAYGIADAHAIRPGDRVLVDTAHQEQPIIWLLAPLLRGASIVLCAGLDRSTLDERVAAERVTHVF